jgi:peptidoglycan/LPS O-acetylase OafA/YrhL
MNGICAPARTARFIELDSLRGLAALTVVLYHLQILWAQDVHPTSTAVRSLLTQVAPFGTEAVMLFFVLSGFVLSLPAISGRPQSYFTFTVRRIFRIYVPYLAAIAVSVAGAFWLHGTVTASDWFHRSWSEPVNWRLVGQHVLFVGAYNTNQFDNPIWSLVQEMRISLFFPLLCALVLRLKSGWSFAIIAGLGATALALNKGPIPIDWRVQDSVHFAGLFVFGIFLARERDRLGARFLRFPRLARILIGIACLWFYLFAGPGLAGFASRLFGSASMDVSQWITALGAGGLMIVSLNSAWCHKILTWSPIHFLGKVSYSLYLWHCIVLLYCVHLLYGRMPLGAILCLVLVLIVPVSWCSYRWIELPSIALGRRLGDNRLTRPEKVKTQGGEDHQLAPKQGIDAPKRNSVDGTFPA